MIWVVIMRFSERLIGKMVYLNYPNFEYPDGPANIDSTCSDNYD
eukprot:UN11115